MNLIIYTIYLYILIIIFTPSKLLLSIIYHNVLLTCRIIMNIVLNWIQNKVVLNHGIIKLHMCLCNLSSLKVLELRTLNNLIQFNDCCAYPFFLYLHSEIKKLKLGIYAKKNNLMKFCSPAQLH